MPRGRKENRRQRTPVGVRRLKLTLNSEMEDKLKSEGRRPRWVLDEGERIQDFLQGDYEFVEASRIQVKTGEGEEVHEEDRRIWKPAGRRDHRRLYLMALPEKFYKEDQEAKEAANRRVDEAIRGDQSHVGQNHGVDPSKGGTYRGNIQYKP